MPKPCFVVFVVALAGFHKWFQNKGITKRLTDRRFSVSFAVHACLHCRIKRPGALAFRNSLATADHTGMSHAEA
jgi:hypothetical protein